MTVRSPFINNLFSNISQINNNLSFYLFIMEGFEKESIELMQNNPELFLKELYSDNRHSEALNIKGAEFSTHSNVYKNELYKNIYINLYSYMDFYFDSILSLVRKVLTFEGANTQIKKEQELSTLQKIIKLLKMTTNDINDFNNLLNTYDYVRFRRNCLMHNAGESTKSLNNIIKTQGNDLTKYWESKLLRKKDSVVEDASKTKTKFNLEYNFFENEISEFTSNEMIALFNVFRKLSTLWDNIIISETVKKHKKGFLLYCISELNNSLKEKNKVGVKSKDFESKFKGFTFQLFRYKIKDEDIQLLYKELCK
ncbi:hypothetical protein ACDX66_00885 [Peribacillus frigoritolerans]